MQLEINKPFLFLSTAKEVWDAGSRIYSKNGNVSHMFELKTIIHHTKHRDLVVATYYNTGSFMAGIGFASTFTDESTRGCGDAGRDVGMRLSLWIFSLAQS